MKLKNVLILSFLILTLIPAVVISLLLYKSGFGLSKESYMRNLVESINVQTDYISQTIENNMIMDYRFANKNYAIQTENNLTADEQKNNLLKSFQAYLETSEDKITVCILLDQNNNPVYTIGEKIMLDMIESQLPNLSHATDQMIMEFDLGNGIYSLGLVTPILDHEQTYVGSLISVYDKTYLFKIVSSYYEIANTSTYICRENGEIINFRGISDEYQNASIEDALGNSSFMAEGFIETNFQKTMISGYYKNIYNSPWYLVGFVDHTQIYSFTNQFLWIYLAIIVVVFIADVILSVYISKKVVKPINSLIQVIDGYPDSLNNSDVPSKNGYFETQYLQTKFLGHMKTILLVQHNFEGVYQLYQSSAMDDTNIDIDVKKQTIYSNKQTLQTLMNELEVPEGACIVERFTNCFCEKDQIILTKMFENMRDEHLSVTCETEVFTPHLNQKWFHTLVVPMYEDDRLSRLFIQLRDISSFKKQEFKSLEQAKREPLTGLYNRSGFTDLVNQILQDTNQSALHGLLFLDMNDFKLVNDNFGHSAGDDLLQFVGTVLLETISTKDIASRFGGDEFAVFLPYSSVEKIEMIKKTIDERLVCPFHKDNISFVVSVSIGMSLWSSQFPNTLDELLKQADAAMYQTKREYKQRGH